MKILYSVLISFFICVFAEAQTTVWSSDSSDYEAFSTQDFDEDGIGWGVYTEGAESLGFDAGPVFYSESYDSATTMALTPDNVLSTPEGAIAIPADAQTITFQLKVAALDPGFPAETFAIYVYDEAGEFNFDTKIFETTLTEGGDDSAIDIEADIPNTFAGLNIVIIIRHYMTTDQNQLIIDDFLVTSSDVLSINEHKINHVSVYPNPVKDLLYLKSSNQISSAIIFNQLGQEIIRFELSELREGNLNLSYLANGIYTLSLRGDKLNEKKRIVKSE